MKKLNTVVYKNLKRLTYGELITAISNIKETVNSTDDKDINYNSEYYQALVRELDERQQAIL